jgi:nucleotide-binding universal stress UspA family protein
MSNVFSRILVGIDDSEASTKAVTFAARLSSEHGGQLIIAHSVNWLPVMTQIAASGAIIDSTLVIDDLKAEGEALLDRAVNAAKRCGADAQRRALEGEPAQSILAQAAEAKCSLIVMGTHGRKGLERLFVGSTTEAVLRGSTIPGSPARPLPGRANGVSSASSPESMHRSRATRLFRPSWTSRPRTGNTSSSIALRARARTKGIKRTASSARQSAWQMRAAYPRKAASSPAIRPKP